MATTITKPDMGFLEFSEIKESLKNYLKTQETFADWDFEGAGINILLDLLAVNTHYTSFLSNMLAAEMFLDSSSIRGSVVSHAKHLGYTPHSPQAAKAQIDLTITPQTGHTPAAITVPRGTKFLIKNDNESYIFTTIENTLVKRDNDDAYVAEGLDIYEGTIATIAYEVDETNEEQRFLIPNLNADTRTLKVQIQNSASDTTKTTYELADNITTIKSTSKVYWLQETENGFFEVYFGDGVIGKKAETGNIIIIEHIITRGEEANGLGNDANFEHYSGFSTYTVNNVEYQTSIYSIELVDAASGGSTVESIDSIKFLAPRFYDSQNRAVTTQDYKSLLMNQYPSFESVVVWGGEDNDPEDLGNVYIAIKPYSGTEISDNKKTEIKTYLKTLNVVTIEPVIEDPDYTYMVVTTSVKYDQTQTTKSASDITTLVFNTVKNYGNNTLEKFQKNFRFSKLSTLIDEADDSITGNLTNINLSKRPEPATLEEAETFTLQFNNGLETGSLTSDAFVSNGDTVYLDDDSDGNVRLYKLVSGVKTIVNATQGTINYTTGKVVLTSLLVDEISSGEDYFIVTVTPTYKNVDTLRNQILIIDDSDISVTVDTDEVVTD